MSERRGRGAAPASVGPVRQFTVPGPYVLRPCSAVVCERPARDGVLLWDVPGRSQTARGLQLHLCRAAAGGTLCVEWSGAMLN